MRFINLPEPRRGYRYRLWIYDARAEDGNPVPAADITQGSGKSEYLVAFRAATPVQEPFKFVLTLEPLAAGDSARAEPVILLMVQP
ncbi:MAG: hypothetical protein R3E95_19175 [Thiolinea sp.]